MAGVWHGADILPASPREATRPGVDRGSVRADGRTEPLASALPLELDFLAGQGELRTRFRIALEAAPAGVEPLDAVLNEGLLEEEAYYRALARRLGCVYYSGELPFAAHFDPVKSLRSGVAPLAGLAQGARAVIAPRARSVSRLIETTLSGRLQSRSFALASPQRLAALVRIQRGEAILAGALGRLPEALSARRRLSGSQTATALVIALSAVALGAANLPVLIASLFAALWLMFLGAVALRSVACVADGSTPKPALLSDDELPVYTVIAAIYREPEIIGDLVKALDALDYPKSKLDIKIVLEQRDRETLASLLALRLPARYEIVIAPPGAPSTKPRALNVALAEARGDLVVVYDAEDAPSPGQLRLAASRFAVESELDCLQGRLTIRNTKEFLAIEALRRRVRGALRPRQSWPLRARAAARARRLVEPFPPRIASGRRRLGRVERRRGCGPRRPPGALRLQGGKPRFGHLRGGAARARQLVLAAGALAERLDADRDRALA